MFRIGSDIWAIKFVSPTSSNLVDRTGNITLATTDPTNKVIFVSNTLRGGMLRKVLLHELMHCIMVSYGLLIDISRMVKPDYQIELEEYICNLCAEYHDTIEQIIKGL